MAPTDAISAKPLGAFVERSIRKLVSLPELSAQLRLIWVPEAAVAVSVVGAAGAASVVVALATLENAESPVALLARTL